MRHLILQAQLGSLGEAGGHQLGPPLQVGQGHMLQGQAVGLLKVLHCSKCITAAPLHCCFLAEVEVVHAAVGGGVCMVQAGALHQSKKPILR